ncbi:methylated-DNA-[protein]-cysteine S-methyltransferase [Methanolinea mesophila]|uniref:methylated-DNA--[protein]-cysteine S-methyltransferase n=1 Tax=Methanolinea mesophila TaxID=547055 RepID=UPI001FD80623|nr:methylated-DNA--[protein]-cysteine S-methyltransferase [Methanolinea mesophila]MBP1927880.1 methylated-DNA-[protein]-cysteine S-methyltransferase [Methanolinea mesophila]
MNGSCRFGLWHVQVWWEGDTVYRVRFSKDPLAGAVPSEITRFLAGRSTDLGPLRSAATDPGLQYSGIYREVRKIPYGSTRTYGEIARDLGTSPRLVGLAMKRNPTPLLVPCHRVVAKNGPGGFTPSIDLKEQLQALEKKTLSKTARPKDEEILS